ncbi:MAG: metallophosphatase family protein [Planctomycetes bacterium]|nr:metallophosphatase family protein [Planctomycetota bacterium]
MEVGRDPPHLKPHWIEGGYRVRYAIVSDVHGNKEALDAVIERIGTLDCDEIICLGDIVGYGAEPGYCVERIREISKVVVAGNHDYAALGKINIDYFNAHARRATLWTREKLTPEQLQYLNDLPLVVNMGSFTVVHGSLESPELFDYIQTSYDAFLTMQKMQNSLCFIGHSHVPIAFLLKDVITFSLEPEVLLAGLAKVIVNVGSVGQPRDNNPLASFAVYDVKEARVDIHRIPYDIEKSAEKILEAGLPEFLAERLMVGR